MSQQEKEEDAASSDGSFCDDVIKKQIASAWMAEITMKTKSVICPLTVDLTKAAHAETLPFYCVHSISGAGGAELRHLATFLTMEQPLLAIQMPMDRRKKLSAKSIQLVAEYYCKKVLAFHQAHFGKTSFVLGGWSAGATIALEMAQRFARAGQMPALLIAIDKAPQNTTAEIDRPGNSFCRNLGLWLRLKWRASSSLRDFVDGLSQKAFWCLHHQRIYGAYTNESDKLDHISQLAKTTRTLNERQFIESLLEAVQNYQPLPYDGKVLVLITREGGVDRVAERWKAIAKDLKIIKVPGTHASVMNGIVTNGVANLADVRSLAEVLRRELLGQLQQASAGSVTGGSNGALGGFVKLVWMLCGGRRASAGAEIDVTAPSAGRSQ